MRISLSRHAHRAAPPLTALPTAILVGLAAVGVAYLSQAPQQLSFVRMGAVANATLAANVATHDVASDYVYTESAVVPITLSGSSASSTGAGVSISGSTVTITAGGTYRLTGSLTNGQILVNYTGDALVQLILSGVNINNSTTAPLYIADAGKAVVLLAAGTTNTLTDATTYVYAEGEDEPDGALFSKANLSISGTGSLTVNGRAYDGIASKDGLVIASGNITVNAADDGIRGKDYLVVKGGTIGVTTTGGDGLKSTNDEDVLAGYVAIQGGTVTVNAKGDGVSAETDVVTTGGSLNVTAGGGAGVTVAADASAKGLKGTVSVVVGGGTVNANAAEDGLHSDGNTTVEDGTVTIAATDDGLKAEGTVAITGGTTTVSRSYEGIEGLKIAISGGTTSVVASDDGLNASEEGYTGEGAAPNADITVSGGSLTVNGGTDGIDSNGTLNLTGGYVLAQGSSTRGGGEGGLDSNGATNLTGGYSAATGVTAATRAPTSGGRFVQYNFGSSQAANTIVHLAQGGAEILAFRAPKAFTTVLFTSSAITSNTQYQVFTGGSLGGTAHGTVYTGGSVSGATQVGTVTSGTVSGGGQVTTTTRPVTTTTTTRPVTTTTTTSSRPVTTTTTTTSRPVTTTTTTRPVTTTTTTTTSRPVTTTTTTTTPATTTSGGTTAACTAAYSITGSWPGGFQGQVTVTAARAISTWTVAWTFANGQTVTQSWGANVSQSGSAVTATNAAWNGALAASASTTFGFIGSWTSANAAPTATCAGA